MMFQAIVTSTYVEVTISRGKKYEAFPKLASIIIYTVLGESTAFQLGTLSPLPFYLSSKNKNRKKKQRDPRISPTARQL
jgi:hypothetical protein